MKDQSTIYADIVKVEKRADEPNYRYVHARISDETKDLDGQTADYDWLKTALPDWFKWGNVRDMHENNVVGKAKELTDLGPQVRGFDGVLKVVDPTAVIKLDEELFTGVSVGIKGPRVFNNKGVAVHPMSPGVIKGGKIVEISLVDHPCNENCKITVAKDAASGIELITKGATLEKLATVDILKDGALYWYKRAKWNAAARREAEANGHAEAGGRFPIDDASDVSDAVHLINTGHGDSSDRAHVIARAKALGQGNPFKEKNKSKVADPMITAADLETYKSRFHPALANAGVALSDGSYVIMDEGDLILAKALRATGFGNATAAEFLIQRRAEELSGKTASATQQSTPRQPDHSSAPGARGNRDNPDKNAPPPAKPKASKNPDKETPAHQSVAASGSSAAFDDSSAAVHPPTKPKKKDKTKKPAAPAGPSADAAGEPPSHTHGDDTGSRGTQTNTAKILKYREGDPADWSDKKLARALKIFKGLEPDAFKEASNSYQGDGRPLLEQIARSMRGRIYDMVGTAQGSTSADVRIDKPMEAGETGPTEVLNDSDLMRDGDPRINRATPASALGQSGPMNGGDSIVTPGGDSGVPLTSLPFASAPQTGSSPERVAPGALPGGLAAPGDAQPRQSVSGPSGSGGTSPASPPLRPASPAAQAGPDPNAGGGRSIASTTSAFVNPQQQPVAPGTGAGVGSAVPGVATARGQIGGTRSQVTNTARKNAKPSKKGKKRKKTKSAKMINKLAKSVVADRVEAAVPDSVKAAVASSLKKFVKNLEREVLVKYATADQLKLMQDDIRKLGELAQPGGPFVGQLITVDKVVNANEFAQPEVQIVQPDVLEQMERFDRMSKSGNPQLARSAKEGLNKLVSTYFPKEVIDEVTKRKRSATK